MPLSTNQLIKGDFASRALSSLGSRRIIDDAFIQSSIGDFNPDNVTLRDRLRMRQDNMIKMGLHYSKAPMITADYDFICDDPQIRAAVKEAYDQIHVSLMRGALNKYDFGFQAAVKRWELGDLKGSYENEDGEIVPIWPYPEVQPVMMAAPVVLPPDFTRVHLEGGKFAGIKTQLQPKNGGDEDDQLVPPEWSLWFVNEYEEEFGNYYGRARIDSAYRFWWSYWFNYHNRDRHAESDADPALQIWYPTGYQVPDPLDIDPATGSARRVSNRDLALEIGEALRSGATIAWPSDVYQDEQGRPSAIKLWDAAFLQGGENLNAFTSLLADLEISKLRACLVPEQALVQQRDAPSSKNVAGTYGEVFTESLGLDAQYMDEQITKYLIRPFVVANFGEEAPDCRKITTGFKEEDLTLTTRLIEAAFNTDPNALPIKFEELLKRANIPVYSAKELQDRGEAAAELQAQQQEEQAAQQAAMQQEQQPVADMAQLSQRPVRKKYERERLYLHGPVVGAQPAPKWAKREAKQRLQSIDSIVSSLRPVAQRQYQELFDLVVDGLQDQMLALSVQSFVDSIVGKIKSFIDARRSRWVTEMASPLGDAYLAGAAREVARIGLDADSYDVGRSRATEWARERAGYLVTTMSETVVEQFLRPWLTKKFETLGYDGSDTGIVPNVTELVSELRSHFKDYPEWMAERVVRTEARMALNRSAFEIWEDAGVTELQAIDGLGGRTGQTDAVCLARNGETFSIDEAMEEDEDEHPNGTLFWVPVLESIVPPVRGRSPALMASGPYRLQRGALKRTRFPSIRI